MSATLAAFESLSEKSPPTRPRSFGVPRLRGGDGSPPEGGTPNLSAQAGSEDLSARRLSSPKPRQSEAAKLVGFLGFFWLAIGVGFGAEDIKNSDCLLCHEDQTLTQTNANGTVKLLFVDAAKLSGSVH